MIETKENKEYRDLFDVDSKEVYNQLPEYTRIARYAQHNKNKRRRETWSEQTDRVFKMHKVKFQKQLDNEEFMEYFNFAKDMVLKKNVLGSQRALQFGGPAILKKETRMYNCCASYVDRPRVFQEIMFSLLCGVGVGFSVQNHHIAKLPTIKSVSTETKLFQVQDSIEGWSDAIGVLCSSYFTQNQCFPEFYNKQVVFDFSLIRPAGAFINNIGGKAPGSEGLSNSLKKIRDIFDECIKNGFDRLRTIDAYDIIVHSSDAVLSGGIRRSATIALFSLDDEDMIKAKTGDWYIKNPQRARSNNSALLLRDKTPEKQYMDLIQSVKQFGEPGIIWTDNTETLYNPCVPDDTWILTADGSKQVKDLINVPFLAVVDGKEYECKTGFIKTGENKQVYKIITHEGFEVRATNNHKFFTAERDWVELKDLMIGDKISLNDHSERTFTIDIQSDNFVKGWLIGTVYGNASFDYFDKNISFYYTGNNRYSMREYLYKYANQLRLNNFSETNFSDYENESRNVNGLLIKNKDLFVIATNYINKGHILSDTIEKESLLFQCGFLRGLFDMNSVIEDYKNKGLCICLTCTIVDSLKIVQRMLLRLGIYGVIYEQRRYVGDTMIPIYELIINKASMQVYKNNVGFNDLEKKDRLNSILSSYKRRPYGSRYTAEILDIIKSDKCDVYDCTVDDIHAFDANGLYAHNCVEISLYGYDSKGQSGFQFCNLTEINMGTVENELDFYERCKAASILGTFQAAYTDFGYLGEVTENIVKREALLGVSMTGMMDTPDISFDPIILEKGANIVKQINEKVAKIIGINKASRTTCIKPAGSTSCILGTSSGIHPCHSKRYFRRVQSNSLEEPLKFFKQSNPQAVDLSVWSSGKTDEVITFLCKSKNGALTKNDVSAIDLLEKVKLVQKYWVTTGKNIDRCVEGWLNHNVSNTITVKDNEWESAAKFIYDNREYFAGISMLGDSGDMTYHQAPFQAVYSHEEITKLYGAGSVFASGLIVHANDAFDNNLYSACSTLLGYGEKLDMPNLDNNKLSLVQSDKIYKKVRWVAQAKKFANRHFEGDLLKMTYCLKAVDSWKTWCDLKRTYKSVEWEKFIEENDNTKPTEYQACSGGSCEIIRF
jgi:hypothetical protein